MRQLASFSIHNFDPYIRTQILVIFFLQSYSSYLYPNQPQCHNRSVQHTQFEISTWMQYSKEKHAVFFFVFAKAAETNSQFNHNFNQIHSRKLYFEKRKKIPMDSINFSKPRLIKMLWSIIEMSTKYKNYIDLILTEAEV